MEKFLEIKNLKNLLKNSSNLYNNKILYRCREYNISYKNFEEKVNCLGTALINMGLKNKKIAIISENRYEWEVAFFAITCGTGIVIPIDKGLTKYEIQNIVNRTKVEAVFCSSDYEKIILEIKKDNLFLKHVISFDSKSETSFNNVINDGKKILCKNQSCFIDENINEQDICCIIFTSGTTALSKAVMLSHKNICSNIVNVSKVLELTEKDIDLSVLPLNHVLEGLFCFLMSIYKGMERIFCNRLDEIIDYIKKYKITYMGAVPSIYKYLYERKEELILEANHINMFMSGGASLDTEIVSNYKDIGIKLIQGYGLTECSPVVCMENKKNCKNGSVGKNIPNVDIKVINKDYNGVGEIAVKGENVTQGYFEDEESTKKNIVDNWFYTGDLGKIDEEGYVYIYGRNKDLIVMQNGKKIFPEEIEKLLNNIDEVIESFVFEVSIEKDNIKLYTELVYNKNDFLKNTEEEIKEILKKKVKQVNELLPQYKRINNVFITTKPLEKTATRKIKRKEEKEKINKIIKQKVNLENNNYKTYFDRLKQIFIKKLDIEEIYESSNIISDLGADSLDIVEIFLEIEKEFNVKIPVEKRKQIVTIKDILNILKNK